MIYCINMTPRELPVQEGRILRKGPIGSKTIVEVPTSINGTWPGAEYIQKKPTDRPILRKTFKNKRIYLPYEYQQAVADNLQGTDTVVLGMSGYSRISEDNCRTWGIKPRAYEAACRQLLLKIIEHLRDSFSGINIRLAHGAAHMGIDQVAIDVGKTENMSMLGHSCPRFMLHVEDDDVPVYVAKTQEEYSDRFISSTDILIAANGREQSFRHDINAAFLQGKHVIPINVLRSISDRGGPPAFSREGTVEDAVAAFEQRVHLVSQRLGNDVGADPWDTLVRHTLKTTRGICRHLLSPQRAYAS